MHASEPTEDEIIEVLSGEKVAQVAGVEWPP